MVCFNRSPHCSVEHELGRENKTRVEGGSLILEVESLLGRTRLQDGTKGVSGKGGMQEKRGEETVKEMGGWRIRWAFR